MRKVITLTGNVDTDKLEVEIWDGCIILTTYSSHPDADAGEVVLLRKPDVDKLKAHMDQYYETLTTFNLESTGKVIYGTRETEIEEDN